MCQTIDLINAVDESVATIRHLAELGALLDGNPEYFANGIELLSLIAERSGHLEALVSQLTRYVLPGPKRLEAQP